MLPIMKAKRKMMRQLKITNLKMNSALQEVTSLVGKSPLGPWMMSNQRCSMWLQRLIRVNILHSELFPFIPTH